MIRESYSGSKVSVKVKATIFLVLESTAESCQPIRNPGHRCTERHYYLHTRIRSTRSLLGFEQEQDPTVWSNQSQLTDCQSVQLFQCTKQSHRAQAITSGIGLTNVPVKCNIEIRQGLKR